MLARTLFLEIFPLVAFHFVTVHSSIPLLTASTLQQNIYGDKGKFFCLLLHNEGNATTDLESSLELLYKKKIVQSHLIGSYRVSNEIHKLTVISKDATFPFLRCFLGSTLFQDYEGADEQKTILKWIKRLRKKFTRWMENSVETIEETISKNPVTLVAITSLGQASAIRSVCQEVLNKMENHCQMSLLFIHPMSKHKRAIQSYLNVSASSAIAVFTHIDKYSDWESAIFAGHTMLTNQITSHILSRLLDVKHLTVKNFESEALTVRETERFLPYFVGFYAWWAKHSGNFLSSLRSAIEVHREHSILSKFALVNVATEKTVISRYIKSKAMTPLPFLALFQREKGTNSVNHTILKTNHPTAFSLSGELRSLGLAMHNAWNELWVYEPYDVLDITHYSDINEGPFGKLCTMWSHNQTDSEYVPQQRDMKVTQHLEIKKTRIEDLMKKIDGISVMTESLWTAAIEKSEKNLALYTSSSKVMITMIVFMRANCGSCNTKMQVFKQLNKEFLKFENRRLFLVNCSSEEQLCKKLDVKGYPSVTAIRSFGILATHKCSIPLFEQPYISREFHGAIEMSNLISWLDKISESSVEPLNFNNPVDFNKMVENVRLIATIIPKYSTYVPVAPDHDRSYFYSLSCFRLACEMLYGLTSCHAVFSKDIPPSEFKGKLDANMIVVQIQFERKDGILMRLMSMRKSLHILLQEETASNLHLFHRLHQYKISTSQTCEEDHHMCTQTIVAFTRDHLRLPVTALSSEIFHTKNNPLFSEERPVLVALGLQENVTESSRFMQVLYRVASQLYKEIVVTALDVDLYPSWAGRFVPKNYYRHFAGSENAGPLHDYPRLCLIDWKDHSHAAFYPPLYSILGNSLKAVTVEKEPHLFDFVWNEESIKDWDENNLIEYIKNYLKEPSKFTVKTEHF